MISTPSRFRISAIAAPTFMPISGRDYILDSRGDIIRTRAVERVYSKCARVPDSMAAEKPLSKFDEPDAARRHRHTTAGILGRVAVVVLALLAGALFVRDLRATVASDKAKDEECRKYVEQFYRWYADADFGQSGISDSLDDVLDKEMLSRDLADQLDDVLDAEDQHDDV